MDWVQGPRSAKKTVREPMVFSHPAVSTIYKEKFIKMFYVDISAIGVEI